MIFVKSMLIDTFLCGCIKTFKKVSISATTVRSQPMAFQARSTNIVRTNKKRTKKLNDNVNNINIH